MSYCRFGSPEGSQVYVINNASGYFSCYCAVNLANFENDGPVSVDLPARSAMIEHLLQHRADGMNVPEEALERLRREIETEGDAWKDSI